MKRRKVKIEDITVYVEYQRGYSKGYETSRMGLKFDEEIHTKGTLYIIGYKYGFEEAAQEKNNNKKNK